MSPGRSPPTWNRAVKNKNFVSSRPMEYLRNQTREKRRKTDYQWELGKEVIWPWFFLVSFQYVWSYSKNRPKNLLIVDLFNVFMTFLSLTAMVFACVGSSNVSCFIWCISVKAKASFILILYPYTYLNSAQNQFFRKHNQTDLQVMRHVTRLILRHGIQCRCRFFLYIFSLKSYWQLSGHSRYIIFR